MKASNTKKEVTVKQPTVKKVSTYKVNVIDANKALNVEKNSLGAYIDLLIKYDSVLCIEFRSYLKDIKDGKKENYEALKKVVRTTKNGKFNQFYTLQGLQKVCFPK